MDTIASLTLRRFPVTIENKNTGEVSKDTIVIDKETLDASRRVGQSSRELISRMYNKTGFRVLEIGKPKRGNFTISLNELFENGKEAQR